MLSRQEIAGTLPHAGTMCLLHSATHWDAQHIVCTAFAEADGHPLADAGRLSPLCLVEYGAQAAALHGALSEQGRAQKGFIAALRNVSLLSDSVVQGALHIRAERLLRNADGAVYQIQVAVNDTPTLSGRVNILWVVTA